MYPDVFILPRNCSSYIDILIYKKKWMFHTLLSYMQLNQASPTVKEKYNFNILCFNDFI